MSERHRARESRSLGLAVGLLLFAGWMAGCMAAPTPTQEASPTPTENCFSSPVFTASDMQAWLDCHPNDYKMQISKDTVVSFAFSRPMMDWEGPVFVTHVPSLSAAVVNYDGSLFTKDYKTPEGQAAIEAVLNDPVLMARILARANEIQNGPNSPYIFR